MLTRILTTLTLMVAFAFPVTLVATGDVSAQTPKQAACEGVELAGADCGGGGGARISGVLRRVINILSAIVGVVAVIMIIIGGFKYIASGGDASKVASAKNTVIYAIVGLIIVAMAQVIVRFVLGTV